MTDWVPGDPLYFEWEVDVIRPMVELLPSDCDGDGSTCWICRDPNFHPARPPVSEEEAAKIMRTCFTCQEEHELPCPYYDNWESLSLMVPWADPASLNPTVT